MRRGRFARALGAFGFGVAGAPLACRAADTYTMRLTTSDAVAHPFTQAGIHFASGVNRRTNGQVKVEVYPAGQLIAQQAVVDGLVNGIIDYAVQSSATLVSLVPRIQVLDTPFMFKDLPTVFRVLDGPIGDELYAEVEAKGVLPLTWGVGGFKEIETTSKAVVVPEDMKGVRIRVQAGPVGVATYQALGAIPVVIDITETYVALQQHTIDGIDINLSAVTAGKYYALIKHVAMANHILAVEPLMGSRRKIEALPAPLQKIVKEEGKALAPFWRSLTIRQAAADIQTLKSNGVAFTEIQHAAFRKTVEPVYAMVQSRIGGDLLQRVSRAAGV